MLKEVVLAQSAGLKPTATQESLEWWRKDDEDLQEVALQALAFAEPWVQGFKRADLGDGAVFESRRVGPARTLELLRAAQGKPEKQEAILEAAVIFQLVGSTRRASASESCAVERQLQSYARKAYQRAGFPDNKPAWLPVHTCVLPQSALKSRKHFQAWGQSESRIRSLEVLQRRVSATLDSLKQAWTAVVIRPARDDAEARAVRDSFAANPLTALFQARVQGMLIERDRLAAEQVSSARRRRSAEARELRELKAKHPRWGQWRQLPDAELKGLVWQKQLTALADEFGVTDTAIRKRCDARGIERPPQGYWLRGDQRQLG